MASRLSQIDLDKVINCCNPLRNDSVRDTPARRSDITEEIYNNIYYRVWYYLKRSTIQVSDFLEKELNQRYG